MSVTIKWDPWRSQPWYLPRQGGVDAAELERIETLLCTRPELRKSTIAQELFRLLDSAKKQIMCCSFLLGGEQVRDALVRAVQRLRGHVYVITAVDDRMLARSMEEELLADGVSDYELKRQIKRFESLTKAGVYVRGADNCHAKFCVVDNRQALVGSANFDENGLDLHGKKRSGELGLLIRDAARASHLRRLFRQIWLDGCGYEVPPDPAHYTVRRLKPAKLSALEPPPTSGRWPVWTGFRSRGILDMVQQCAREAKKHLALASYSFTGMAAQRELVVQPILEARQRGVDVELYVRNRSVDLPELGSLLDAGVNIRGDTVNHAKYVMVDRKYGALFSANFDGRHGLTNGIEAGCRLTAAEVKDLVRYHQAVWEGAPTEACFIREPDQLLEKRKDISSDLPPDMPAHARVEGLSEQVMLAEEIARGPCLLLRQQDGDLQLLGPKSGVILRKKNNGFSVEALAGPAWQQPNLVKHLAQAIKHENRPCWLPLGWTIQAVR